MVPHLGTMGKKSKLVIQLHPPPPPKKKVSGSLTLFLPTPLAGAWVNRWTFFPLPSHLQRFVSVRDRTFLLGTENAMGGCGSLAVYAILLFSLLQFLYIFCTRTGGAHIQLVVAHAIWVSN